MYYVLYQISQVFLAIILLELIFGRKLDVDFIGGLGPLTKEEEKAIGKFMKAEKAKRVMKKKQTTKTRKKTRTKQLLENREKRFIE